MTRRLNLDAVIGRAVWSIEGQRLGRLEECRAERNGDSWFVREWLIGPAGLLERLGSGAWLLVGTSRARGYIVRWDQLDLTDPERPRLTCPVARLQTNR